MEEFCVIYKSYLSFEAKLINAEDATSAKSMAKGINYGQSSPWVLCDKNLYLCGYSGRKFMLDEGYRLLTEEKFIFMASSAAKIFKIDDPVKVKIKAQDWLKEISKECGKLKTNKNEGKFGEPQSKFRHGTFGLGSFEPDIWRKN